MTEEREPLQRPHLLYLLPNLFTSVSIFLGLLSVIYSAKGDFEKAIWLIAASVVFDGLDGRIARLTNTTSNFGVEFDSLADLVAFGMAPAMLLYFYAGVQYGKLGVVAVAIFVIFGAVRLARFNVITSSEPNVFIGIPIPAAAMIIVFAIFNMIEYGVIIDKKYLLFLSIVVAITMVSNVRYPSFKKFAITPQNRLRFFVVTILVLFGAYIAPEIIIFLLVFSYFVFGLFRALYFLFLKKVKL